MVSYDRTLLNQWNQSSQDLKELVKVWSQGAVRPVLLTASAASFGISYQWQFPLLHGAEFNAFSHGSSRRACFTATFLRLFRFTCYYMCFSKRKRGYDVD